MTKLNLVGMRLSLIAASHGGFRCLGFVSRSMIRPSVKRGKRMAETAA